ncbi:Kunitz/Bovine pancreatic trypsin inhibitor domain protein, partial [Trichostrongylus colubriformis]
MFHAIAILLLIDFGYTLNCHLPRDLGYSCDEPEKKLFYYDSRIGACQPMFHRGCGGNENKFKTLAECKQKCVPSKNATKATGSNKSLVVVECQIQTDAKIPDIAQKCDNGCPMGYSCNKNNRCCPMKDYICSLPAASGYESPSLKHYGRYVYMPGLSNCIRFSYFGNGGNFNNFLTYKE